MNILENNYDRPLEGAHHLEGHSLYGGSSNAGLISHPYINTNQPEGDNFEVTNQRGFVIRGLKPVKTPVKPLKSHQKKHSQAQSPRNNLNVMSNRDLEDVGGDNHLQHMHTLNNKRTQQAASPQLRQHVIEEANKPIIHMDGMDMPEQLLNNNANSRQQNSRHDGTNKSSIPPEVLIDMQKNNIFNTTSNQEDTTIDKNEPIIPVRKDKILQALENIGQRKISQKAFRGEMTQG